ncbi:MAG: hypothetical protein HYV63_20475 [Candidatus Schekmanbacteria bacterium]|nr:hypothetical protein [Candidatus Schekmanbacteria bacterium]
MISIRAILTPALLAAGLGGGEAPRWVQRRLGSGVWWYVTLLGCAVVPAWLAYHQASSLFGWGRPVDLEESDFANPRRDRALVGASVPLTYLAMALLWTIAYHALDFVGVGHGSPPMLAAVYASRSTRCSSSSTCCRWHHSRPGECSNPCCLSGSRRSPGACRSSGHWRSLVSS